MALVKLRRRSDPGKTAARLACGALSLVGLLPLVLSLLVHLPWARREVAELVLGEVRGSLGLSVGFDLRLELLPPAVVLERLRVESSVPGEPAITADRVKVGPRLFSLLGGRLNVGDVEVVSPTVQLRVEGGKLANLPIKPSPPGGSAGGSFDVKNPPFRSLTIDGARAKIELVDAGVDLSLSDADVDVSAVSGALDVGLSVAEARVRRERAEGGGKAVDDDSLCGLRARAHYDDDGLLVRSLDLSARLDRDPKAGEAPSCAGEGSPEEALALGLSRLRVRDGGEPLPSVTGGLRVQGPLRVVKRFVPTAPSFSGAVALVVELQFKGRPGELPEARGRLLGREVMVDNLRTVVHTLDAQLEVGAREVRIPVGKATHSDGELTLKNVKALPFEFGVPVTAAEIEVQGVMFPGLMRDTGITKHTIVKWRFDRGAFTDIKGLAYDPVREGPSLMSDVWMDTSDFELGDRGWDDPKRRRVVNVRKARVKGRFGVEPYGVLFRQMTAEFGGTRLDVPVVTVGFDDRLDVRVSGATRIALNEISPVVNLPVGGTLEVNGTVCCTQSDPKVEGDLRGTHFQMAGLPLADSMMAHAVFKPFILELSRVHGAKSHDLEGGKRSAPSHYQAGRIRVDFDRPQGMLVEGNVSTDKMDYRDLLDIFQFEKDPRFKEINGTGSAQASMRFEAGGPGDPCDTGAITLRSRFKMNGDTVLYGEHYTGGEGEADLSWFDREALERGMDAEIRALTLRKGKGVISGAGTLRRGAKIAGHFSAQEIPLSQVDALHPSLRTADGSISATGRLSGTVESPEVDSDVRMTPVRIGQKVLPASTMSVRLVPAAKPAVENPKRSHKCREIIPRNFDPKDFAKDEVKGIYHTDGELFGGQLTMRDVQTTWQREKRVSGEILAREFDLGALFQFSPSAALAERPPTGKLSGRTVIESMELEHLDRSVVNFTVRQLEVRQGTSSLALKIPKGSTSVAGTVQDDTLRLGAMLFDVNAGSGVGAEVGLSGRVEKLTTEQKLDLDIQLSPIEIGALLEGLPKVESASGRLEGRVAVQGRADAPVARGELRLRNGELAVRGAPFILEDIEMTARVDEQEFRIVQALAKAGGGQVQLSARAPLRGLQVSEMSAQLEARGVRLPVSDGVEMVADASLGTSWTPPSPGGPRRRARVTGSVTLQNFLYTRPIGVAADLDSLARKGKRTEVSVYDPEEDTVDLAIRVLSPRPLAFRNNLLEADVSLESSLLMTGTNQRFGLQGLLRINPGGRLRLRSNEFDIRQGTIRFDDPLRIAPRVDLSANTEYRRATTSASGGPAAAAAGGTASTGGLWRILMHAYGDADNLKIDLSSDPNLAQEDIILLLTVGMTRAELDQLQASNLGSTAALEALSALSGADRAVKTVIPIIDDFRFGSAYSSRTGRTEPTVTVGKRISDRIRANVVTGLSENRDVRSYLEWKTSPNTSIIGNYDNLSDVASRGLGNLGADFRVRLEF